MDKEDSDKKIVSRLDEMFTQHESGKVFVTDRAYFEMKDVFKRARKNYLGIYEQPKDPVTGQEKYWPPLTETFTDGVEKSIDIDINDIDLYTKNQSKVAATRIMDKVLKEKLYEAGFSKALNDLKSYLSKDGDGILKFVDDVDPDTGKRCMRISAVDNLNIICDQSAEDINHAFGSLERCLMTQDELRAKKDVWDGVDEVIESGASEGGKDTFNRYNLRLNGVSDTRSVGPVYPVYDYWGQVEKSWITENESDSGEWVEGHVVVAGLGGDRSRKRTVLLKELNKNGKRPYGEAVLKKVIGRRSGRGVPEMLFGTQNYMNMLMDIRKKNAQILQNGLFKAKKGMGLTADSIISKVTAGGIVPVNEMDDFQQMPVDDTRASSYNDEDRLLAWGERNTGQYDIRRGESLAASAPATTQLLQDRNSRNLYEQVREHVGLMLEKFLNDHVLPWLVENVEDDEVVSITGSLMDLKEFDEMIAEHKVNQAFVRTVERTGRYPNPESLVAAKQMQMSKLAKQGDRRYLKLKKSLFTGTDAAVRVIVTNEEIDKNVILSKLQEMLTLSVSNPGALSLDAQGMVDTIFDLMGLPSGRVYSTRMDQPTPIDRIQERQERIRQERQLAERKAQAAQGSQPMNRLIGRSAAPQSNSRASAGPAGSPAGRPVETTPDNVTALNR